MVTVPLVENAPKVPVTNANRNEFVRLYLDWILNKGIYEKFRAFYLGFHSVCASNALIVIILNYKEKFFDYIVVFFVCIDASTGGGRDFGMWLS